MLFYELPTQLSLQIEHCKNVNIQGFLHPWWLYLHSALHVHLYRQILSENVKIVQVLLCNTKFLHSDLNLAHMQMCSLIFMDIILIIIVIWLCPKFHQVITQVMWYIVDGFCISLCTPPPPLPSLLWWSELVVLQDIKRNGISTSILPHVLMIMSALWITQNRKVYSELAVVALSAG